MIDLTFHIYKYKLLCASTCLPEIADGIKISFMQCRIDILCVSDSILVLTIPARYIGKMLGENVKVKTQ